VLRDAKNQRCCILTSSIQFGVSWTLLIGWLVAAACLLIIGGRADVSGGDNNDED